MVVQMGRVHVQLDREALGRRSKPMMSMLLGFALDRQVRLKWKRTPMSARATLYFDCGAHAVWQVVEGLYNIDDTLMKGNLFRSYHLISVS